MFYNETGIMGQAIYLMTVNITGSLFLTLLLMVLFFMACFMMFRLPVELTALFILPLLIILMAYQGEFLAIGGVITVYLAIIFAKNFLIR